MSYVFDASSILTLIGKLGEKIVDVMKGNLTVSLAYYEVGNALWKECKLAKRLTIDEAAEVLDFTFSLLDLMEIVHTKDGDLGVQTLSNAIKLNITYYDAAYLTATQKLDKVLITDDEKLIATARKIEVKTSPSKRFL